MEIYVKTLQNSESSENLLVRNSTEAMLFFWLSLSLGAEFTGSVILGKIEEGKLFFPL